MFRAFIPQRFEETLRRKIQAGIGGNRLKDNGCDVVVLVKRRPHRADVIERERNRQIGKRLRNARAIRPAMRQGSTACTHQQRVNVTVIAAFELDDLVPAGEAAGEPDARHGRFGAAVHHPHLLDRGHPFADQLGHLDFEWIWNSEADAPHHRFMDRIDHYARCMTQNRRAPGSDVINVLVAIDVPNLCAFSALDKERLAIQSAKCAHGGIHTSGDSLLRGSEKLF